MSKILNNYDYYRKRTNIEKHNKYDKINHLSNEKGEKIYEYYICDYCHSEIIIKKKRQDMDGGIVEIPASLTNKAPISLVLCSKCLNPVMRELENARSGENHIPRLN